MSDTVDETVRLLNRCAERATLADAILRAAGSGLRHYSMASTRSGILAATEAAVETGRAQADNELRAVIQPFIDVRHQNGAWGVISKQLDGMAPVTVTVTKAQMLAAITKARRTTDGEEG